MTASRGHVPGWVSPPRPTLGYGLVAWPTSAGTPDDGRLGSGGRRPRRVATGRSASPGHRRLLRPLPGLRRSGRASRRRYRRGSWSSWPSLSSLTSCRLSEAARSAPGTTSAVVPRPRPVPGSRSRFGPPSDPSRRPTFAPPPPALGHGHVRPRGRTSATDAGQVSAHEEVRASARTRPTTPGGTCPSQQSDSIAAAVPCRRYSCSTG
jgi:hypothetical protein